MKQFKKLIACVLAATLVLGSTTVFFGAQTTVTDKNRAEGSVSGGITIEGIVDREVFSVLVPTVATSDKAYDFVLDPEQLITETNGGKFASGVSIQTTGGSMYFQVSGDAYDVSSQKATFTNMSSVDVVVSLNATVTVAASNSAVKFVDSDNFSSSTSLDVYLAIEGEDAYGNKVSGSAISTAATTASGNTYSTTITTELASYNVYKVGVSGSEYIYEIDRTKADETTPAAYTFWLTGACNTNADWTGYDETANPTIDLVWSVKIKGAEGGNTASPTPLIARTEYTSAKANLSVALQLGTGDTAATGIFSIKTGNSATSFGTTNYLSQCPLSSDKTTLTLPLGTFFSGAKDGDVRYVQVVFNDTAKTTVVLKITFDF